MPREYGSGIQREVSCSFLKAPLQLASNQPLVYPSFLPCACTIMGVLTHQAWAGIPVSTLNSAPQPLGFGGRFGKQPLDMSPGVDIGPAHIGSARVARDRGGLRAPC